MDLAWIGYSRGFDKHLDLVVHGFHMGFGTHGDFMPPGFGTSGDFMLPGLGTNRNLVSEQNCVFVW